jgi:hypothetical protein
MNANGNRFIGTLLRLGFAGFGGVLLALVVPLMFSDWAWAYLHSPLPLLLLPIAMAVSYWLYPKLPRSRAATSRAATSGAATSGAATSARPHDAAH